MDRRDVIKVLGSAGVIALAGCAESTSTGTPEVTTRTTEAPTWTTEATPTATAQDTQTESGTESTETTEASISPPTGFSEKGIEDVEGVVDAHRSFLAGLTSYSERWELEMIDADGERSGDPTVSEISADAEQERVLGRYVDHAWDVEFFYDGTFYEYNADSEEVTRGESPELFTDIEKAYDPLRLWAVEMLLETVLELPALSSPTQVTLAGQPGLRFEVVDASSETKENAENVTYTGASGHVSVTGEGGIVDLEVIPEFESENTTLQTTLYEVSGIDSTTVERPGWLSE